MRERFVEFSVSSDLSDARNPAVSWVLLRSSRAAISHIPYPIDRRKLPKGAVMNRPGEGPRWASAHKVSSCGRKNCVLIKSRM